MDYENLLFKNSSYFLKYRHWLNTEENNQKSVEFEEIPFRGVFEYQWLIEHINNKDFIMWTNWIMKLENFINQYSSISDNHKSFIDTLITNHQNYKMIEDVMINHFFNFII